MVILEKKTFPPFPLPPPSSSSSNSHSYIILLLPTSVPFLERISLPHVGSCCNVPASTTQPVLINGRDLNWNVISEPRESKEGGDVGGTQNSCGVVLWVRVCCVSRNEGCSMVFLFPLFSSF